MKIQDVQLYLIDEKAGGQSDDWRTEATIASPMSEFEAYGEQRSSWMGPGNDPFAIELTTEDGTTGIAVNSAGGPPACEIIDGHFRWFIEGRTLSTDDGFGSRCIDHSSLMDNAAFQ
ncbi:hypothetical protein ACFQJ8_25385 [Halocatena marina]|uniref:hypothetical protein n=1 Tax=Halocatena marina TaxID=2934937 RepID=UPI00361D66C6